MSAFQSAKMTLVECLGLSRDACHIYVGLGVFLVAVVVLRRWRATLLPWLLVVLAAGAGEALDRYDDLRTLGYWEWGESVHDMWNTLFWPTVLFLLMRSGLLNRKGAR